MLFRSKGNDLIKIVTGIRRCGKSFLLNNLFIEHLRTERVDDAHIIRLSLEGVANRKYRDPEFSYAYVTERIKDFQTHYIIIDEVQLMTDFVEVLNGFLQLQNVDVYVTGSNSRFLSSDIVTEFRGRGDVVRLHPLRFPVYAFKDVSAYIQSYLKYMKEKLNEITKTIPIKVKFPITEKFKIDTRATKILDNNNIPTYFVHEITNDYSNLGFTKLIKILQKTNLVAKTH